MPKKKVEKTEKKLVKKSEEKVVGTHTHHITDINKIREDCIRLAAPGDKTGARVCVIDKEFEQAFSFMKDHPRSVTFFGSARTHKTNPYYEKAKRLAARIATELKYTVVSGGGAGIMAAANQGAHEAGGQSLGFTIKLPREQRTNQYVTETLPFYFFFSRKVTLAYSAEAYIFFPGGFGTLDEFFELATLIQTEKISNVPMILVGSEFWNPLHTLIEGVLYERFHTISKIDMNIYKITDNEEEILEIVRNAPIRTDD